MPLYEYRCHDCGEFTALRSLADYNAPMYCPECNAVAVKIVSVPNINLNSGSLSAIAKSDSTEPKLVNKNLKSQPNRDISRLKAIAPG